MSHNLLFFSFCKTSKKTTFSVFLSFFLVKLSKSEFLKLNISRMAWPILIILVSFCRILNGLSDEINLFWRCSSPLRLLTHVKVSVRCLFKDDQFSLLVWLLLSLLFLCFHIQKQLILHALAINPSVLIELHLGISNMHHLIVGQVGIKIITSITGGEESNPL